MLHVAQDLQFIKQTYISPSKGIELIIHVSLHLLALIEAGTHGRSKPS